jgi:hypothetical protein
LAGRWHPVFSDGSPQQVRLPHDEPVAVAERLLRSPLNDAAAAEISSVLWEKLIGEEWAESTPLGPAVRLDQIERDWLELALSSSRHSIERALAGLLQAFLLRAEGLRQWRQQAGGALQQMRDRLLALPAAIPTAAPSRGARSDLRLPQICSIAVEAVAAAELYWCYGFRSGWPEERRDRPEAACLYLIALCRQEPAAADVRQWSRRLQEESRALPLFSAASKTPAAGLGPRYELWLALPRGASLTAVAGERRVHWETLANLLSEQSAPAAAPLPALPALEGGESRAGLQELEARAQWLEEELATAREQFHSQTRRNLLAQKSPAAETSSAAAASAPEDSASRLSLSAGLLVACAELLALQSQSDPATLDAARQIQRRAEQLAEALRLQEQSRRGSVIPPPASPSES